MSMLFAKYFFARDDRWPKIIQYHFKERIKHYNCLPFIRLFTQTLLLPQVVLYNEVCRLIGCIIILVNLKKKTCDFRDLKMENILLDKKKRTIKIVGKIKDTNSILSTFTPRSPFISPFIRFWVE